MRPKELLEALVAAEVDFVLIGGLAAFLQGTSRVTRDIDIAYATDKVNLQRLCAVVNRFEPRQIVLGKADGDILTLTPERLRAQPIIQLATTVGEIDMLNKIQGFNSYGYVKALSYDQSFDSVTVPVLSVEGLIKAKRAMKRPKDLQDIAELEAIKEVREQAVVEQSGRSFRVR